MFDYKDEDEKSQLSVIKDLMKELAGEMEPSEDDFAERLGRKKPDLEVVKVGVGMSPKMEHEMGEDDGEMLAETENPVSDSMKKAFKTPPKDPMDSESPMDKFKKRLMALRA